MVNRFGDNLSVGPMGRKGLDSFNFIDWIPQVALRMFRESEVINIYFNTKTDGIIFKDETPVGLKNHGSGPNPASIHTFPKISQIKHDRYCMELKNSLFKIPVFTGSSPSTTIFAITFKALGHSEIERFLFSNDTLTRAISVKGSTWTSDTYLTIYSAGHKKEILFDYTEWHALLLQYKCEEGTVSCKYYFDEDHGSLPNGEEDKITSTNLFLGGHPLKDYANHAVGSYEMYSLNKAEYLPDNMVKLLITDILERVDEED